MHNYICAGCGAFLDPGERCECQVEKRRDAEQLNPLSSLFKNHNSIVLFDVETTGLDCESCEIIELAALKLKTNIYGSPRIDQKLELFIKLPEGQRVPEEITKLTGITDEKLEKEGVSRTEAATLFSIMLSDGPTLMVAHNAHFDVSFVGVMLRKENKLPTAKINVLDTLTIYKDRREYPHRLENAIEAYNLKDKVRNSHRAIDDVHALYEVLKAMAKERDDLVAYINLIGYNPKYGVNGRKLKNLRYEPQPYGQRETLVQRLGIA
jgi:DNA polymerase III epsilon subunit family exonuclease